MKTLSSFWFRNFISATLSILLSSLLSIVVSLVVSTVASTSALAAVDGSEAALWVGGSGGVFVPNKSGTSARSQLGLTVGAKIGSELAIGGYYSTSQKAEGAPHGQFDVAFYGIEGSYHFEGEARGAYFGARIGITKMDFGLSPNEVTASPFHVGLIGGYNHWLSRSVSVGGDLGFYSVSKGEATSRAGVTSTVDSFTALSFLATAKFWL